MAHETMATPTRSSRRRGRMGLRLALLGGTLAAIAILGLAGLEIGLRVTDALAVARARTQAGVAGDAEGFWAVYDPDMVYRLRPGRGRVNLQGFLGDPVSRGAQPHPFRLLVLGDSVGYYGDGPRDTYVDHLSEALRSDPRLAPVEIVNSSTPGYTDWQELQWLRKFGLALEPDLVAVAFVLNDLHHTLHGFRIENGRIVGDTHRLSAETEARVSNPLIRLGRRSRAVLWLKDRLTILGSLAEMLAGDAYTFEYRPDFSNAWQSAAWLPVERQLSEMMQLGREHGFRLVVWVFPYAQQLREDYLARDRDYVLYPQRRLKAICEGLGIPFLDLYSSLAHPESFLDDDVHLSPVGRVAAAAPIARFLSRARLIRARSEASGG
ncbi:MAG: SGNH/GDSL hydrolase family protein [Myxococcota bacterium]